MQAALLSAAEQIPPFDEYSPQNDLRPDPVKLAHELRVLQISVEKVKTLIRELFA